IARGRRRRGNLARLVVGGDDGVALDFPVDLDGHEAGPLVFVVLVSGLAAWPPAPPAGTGGAIGVLPGGRATRGGGLARRGRLLRRRGGCRGGLVGLDHG